MGDLGLNHFHQDDYVILLVVAGFIVFGVVCGGRMKKFKFVYLRVDGLHVDFNEGVNYIVGKNASGKSTLFGYIKYALGVVDSLRITFFEQVEVAVSFSGEVYSFKRLAGDPELAVRSASGEVKLYRARSSELDRFFSGKLSLEYLFEVEGKRAFDVFEFGFLSDAWAFNRRQQWDALCAVCGVDNAFLDGFHKEISELKASVRKNKESEAAVDGFSELLLANSQKEGLTNNLDALVERSKMEFYKEYRLAEKLFADASLKYDEGRFLCDKYISEKIKLIDEAVSKVLAEFDLSKLYYEGAESLAKGKDKGRTSQGEGVLLRFILLLVIADLSATQSYNFSGVIVNDGYLYPYLDNGKHSVARQLLERIISKRESIQYIEFTIRDDVPKDKIVLDLDDLNGLRSVGRFKYEAK